MIEGRKSNVVEDTITIAEDNDATAGVDLDGKPILGLLVPVLNDTPALTFEVSIDGGENWYSLKNKDGSTDSISITGGATAFFVSSDDLTPLTAYSGRLPGSATIKVRIVSSEAQDADRAFSWIVLG